jgi:hypothetical protein
MRARTLLLLISAKPSQARNRANQAGFSLAMALFIILTVILGSVALASRATLGNLGAAFQGESREAREAAEAGLATVISTLNQEPNRRLLVSNVALNNWTTTNSALQNPCLVNGSVVTNPTPAAINFKNNAAINVGVNADRQFRLESITVKNFDRSRRLLSNRTTSNPTTPAYSDNLVNLGVDSSGNPQVGYLEVTVEGIFRGSTARITREFQVVPKCCKLSFGSGQPLNGNDLRDCRRNFPRLLVGITGGGATAYGVAQVGVQDAPGTKPNEILCVNSGSTCPPATGTTGGSTSSIDGVPVRTIDLTLPPVPNYLTQIGGTCPVGQDCSQGAVITSNSTSSRDYLRVNAAGTAVELCNVDSSSNTTATQTLDVQLSPNFISSCSTANINEFCAKSTINGVESFNCRISSMRVCDDTSAAGAGNGVCGEDSVNSTGGGVNEASRANNNSFIIDSTRMPINLFFNQAWAPTTATRNTNNTVVIDGTTRINLVGGFDDGQIQHVSCPSSLPAGEACTVKASPDDSTRAVIYSDAAMAINSGDDGFIRDLFIYAPRGTLNLLSDNDNTDNAFRPNYRGSMWINNLVMGRSNRSTYITQLDVPPFSNSFFVPPGFPPAIFDWVARSSSSTSLF